MENRLLEDNIYSWPWRSGLGRSALESTGSG